MCRLSGFFLSCPPDTSGSSCDKVRMPCRILYFAFENSLFHSAGFVSHSVKYVSHTVVFVFHSVKQRICHNKMTYIQKGKDVLSILKQKNFRTRQETVMSFRIQMSCIVYAFILKINLAESIALRKDISLTCCIKNRNTVTPAHL
jgi:hypothetical protein